MHVLPWVERSGSKALPDGFVFGIRRWRCSHQQRFEAGIVVGFDATIGICLHDHDVTCCNLVFGVIVADGSLTDRTTTVRSLPGAWTGMNCPGSK